MALDVFCGDICGIERIVAPGAWRLDQRADRLSVVALIIVLPDGTTKTRHHHNIQTRHKKKPLRRGAQNQKQSTVIRPSESWSA
jgi:hypothetical protein